MKLASSLVVTVPRTVVCYHQDTNMDEDSAYLWVQAEQPAINTLPLTSNNLQIHDGNIQDPLPIVLSAMRTSSSDRRALETPTSLDESHYEILSSSGIFSDDEGNTVSVASQSVDGDTPDEFSSVNDTDEWTREEMDDSDERDEAGSHEEQMTGFSQIDTPSGTGNDEIDESGLTARPGCENTYLDFTQHAIPGTETEELRSVLPCIPADTFGAFRSGPFELENPVKATVEMMASTKPTRLPMPFRILFVGDLYSQACDLVLEQIGQALREPNSRSNIAGPIKVTPTPNSQTSNSLYGLMPSSGVEMHIDHCVHAHRLGELELHDGSLLRVQDGKFYRATSGSQELCDPPHLVLYLHSEPERWTTDFILFDMVYNTLTSCNVAVLEVAKTAYHTNNPLPLPGKSLKLAVNGVDENHITVRLPVDLDLFCRIPPAILNRHLGYLLQETKSQESWPAVQHDKWRFAISTIHDCWDFTLKAHQPCVYRFWTTAPKLQLIALLFVLLAIISSMVVPQCIGQRGTQVVVPQTPAPTPMQSSTFTQSVSSTTTIVRLAQTAEFRRLLTPLSDGNTLSHHSFSDLTMKALGRPQPSIEAKTQEVSDKFTANVVGTNVFGIWPPTALIKSKKLPEISIKVRRGSEPLSHRVTVVSNTGYVVELEPADAHGLLSILIATTGKPKIVQNLSVDFGNSWLKVPVWSKAYSSIKHFMDISKPRKEPPGDNHRDIVKPLIDQFSSEVWKLAELYHRNSKAAIKEIKSSTEVLIKQANKDMKQLQDAIRREIKAQQKTTKLLVAQCNEIAKSMVERAALVQREVAETVELRVKTLANVMRNTAAEVVGPVRKAKAIKKASANAKWVLEKMKDKSKKRMKATEGRAKKWKTTAKAELKERAKEDTGLLFYANARGQGCDMKREAKGNKHRFRCTEKGECGKLKTR